VFVLVGLAGAPGYVGISWVFAWLGLFLTVTVLLLLMPGRRRPETLPRVHHQSWCGQSWRGAACGIGRCLPVAPQQL